MVEIDRLTYRQALMMTHHVSFAAAAHRDIWPISSQHSTVPSWPRYISNTRYHGVELGQVSCGKQTGGCGSLM